MSSRDDARRPAPPSYVPRQQQAARRGLVADLCTKVGAYLKVTAGDSSGADEERYRAKQAREIASLHQKLDAMQEENKKQQQGKLGMRHSSQGDD